MGADVAFMDRYRHWIRKAVIKLPQVPASDWQQVRCSFFETLAFSLLTQDGGPTMQPGLSAAVHGRRGETLLACRLTGQKGRPFLPRLEY